MYIIYRPDLEFEGQVINSLWTGCVYGPENSKQWPLPEGDNL